MNFCFSGFLCFILNFYLWVFLFAFLSCTWSMPVLERPIPTSLKHDSWAFAGQHDSLPKDHTSRLCGSFKRTLEPEHKLHLLFIFMIYYWLVLSTILILDFVRDCSRQYPKVGRVECLSALFIFTNCIYWICPRELALIWYLWFVW